MNEEKSLDKYRKYDYLNKYTQLQIIENNTRSRGRSKSRSPDPVQIFQQKVTQKLRSNSKTPSKSVSYNRKAININTNSSDSPRKIFNNIPQLSNGLSQQIANQNEILRGQVNQYRRLVTKLEGELSQARHQIIYLKQSIINENCLHEKNITMLNKQVEHYKYQYQILNQEMYNNAMQVQETVRQKQRMYEEMYISLLRKICKSLGICKMENQGVYVIQGEVYRALDNFARKTLRYEDLIQNINEMYNKIENRGQSIKIGDDREELKPLWHWVKKIGKTYQNTNKIKPLLIQKYQQKHVINQQRISQLLRMQIDELLHQLLFTC